MRIKTIMRTKPLSAERRFWLSIVLLACSILTCLIVGEIIVRHYGHYDEDGNFFFWGRLTPYRLPIVGIQKKLDEYSSAPHCHIVYDPTLGWTSRPRARSGDGFYHYNSDGIRTSSVGQEIPRIPPRGTLRIAIFGDSFSHGDGVSYENTFGHYVEDNLKAAGVNAEVLNFGVQGYGMDQAFLRWKTIGYKFSPHIVLFGLSRENMNRNLNLIRLLLYVDDKLPFSKPRYILEDDGLKLINLPALEPANIISAISDMESWDLSKFEYWFDPEDYIESWWAKSKLICLVTNVIYRFKRKRMFYSSSGEPVSLTVKIIEAFRKDVESKGAKFYIVNLPLNPDLKRLLRRKEPLHSEVLKRLSTAANIINPEDRFIHEARNSSLEGLFSEHYSMTGNKIVGQEIARSLLSTREIDWGSFNPQETR